ncbi:hypothetical protein ACFE04_004709 [Oxalis oulophora]
MEQSSSRRYNVLAQQQNHEDDGTELREWALKARSVISRENTLSRRYSASYIRPVDDTSFRSFRSNFTISSTASSPGYTLKDEIDPSTYSFTTALRALQTKTMYNSWECSSPDGFALNSKWSEAEKYICNPLSGQVPMECLSAKTLSGRSFHNKFMMTNRITMSAPLVYSSSTSSYSNSKLIPNLPISLPQQLVAHSSIPVIAGKKMEGKVTRDVGIQSTPPDHLSSPSPTSTPSIIDRPSRKIEPEESEDSTNSMPKFKPKVEVEEKKEKKEEKGKEEIILCRYCGLKPPNLLKIEGRVAEMMMFSFCMGLALEFSN